MPLDFSTFEHASESMPLAARSQLPSSAGDLRGPRRLSGQGRRSAVAPGLPGLEPASPRSATERQRPVPTARGARRQTAPWTGAG